MAIQIFLHLSRNGNIYFPVFYCRKYTPQSASNESAFIDSRFSHIDPVCLCLAESLLLGALEPNRGPRVRAPQLLLNTMWVKTNFRFAVTFDELSRFITSDIPNKIHPPTATSSHPFIHRNIHSA